MKASPHKWKHQAHKAVRQAQKSEYQQEEKLANPEEIKRYYTSPKKAKIYRGKVDPAHKHHKTSPQEVNWQTEPDSVHKEGFYWVEVIRKKTKEGRVRFRKHEQKRKIF